MERNANSFIQMSCLKRKQKTNDGKLLTLAFLTLNLF